jgi:hypothetical protein
LEIVATELRKLDDVLKMGTDNELARAKVDRLVEYEFLLGLELRHATSRERVEALQADRDRILRASTRHAEQFLLRYPDDPAAEEVRLWMAYGLERRCDLSGATERYTALASSKNRQVAVLAQVGLGEIALNRGETLAARRWYGSATRILKTEDRLLPFVLLRAASVAETEGDCERHRTEAGGLLGKLPGNADAEALQSGMQSLLAGACTRTTGKASNTTSETRGQ